MTKFSLRTNDVTVSVEPNFDKERSNPNQGQFVFSYVVDIQNDRAESIQINHRSWVITDSFGNMEIVEGVGVVGEQPIIPPGQTYRYTSYCPLRTSFGSMKGSYLATDPRGTNLKIDIPEFILAHPYSVQ